MTEESQDRLIASVKRGIWTALIGIISGTSGAVGMHAFDVFKVQGRVIVAEARLDREDKRQDEMQQREVEQTGAIWLMNWRLCKVLVRQGEADRECTKDLFKGQSSRVPLPALKSGSAGGH